MGKFSMVVTKGRRHASVLKIKGMDVRKGKLRMGKGVINKLIEMTKLQKLNNGM